MIKRALPLFARMTHQRDITVAHFPHKIVFDIPLSLEQEKSLLVKSVTFQTGRMIVETVMHSSQLSQSSSTATPGLEYNLPRIE